MTSCTGKFLVADGRWMTR